MDPTGAVTSGLWTTPCMSAGAPGANRLSTRTGWRGLRGRSIREMDRTEGAMIDRASGGYRYLPGGVFRWSHYLIQRICSLVIDMGHLRYGVLDVLRQVLTSTYTIDSALLIVHDT